MRITGYATIELPGCDFLAGFTVAPEGALAGVAAMLPSLRAVHACWIVLRCNRPRREATRSSNPPSQLDGGTNKCSGSCFLAGQSSSKSRQAETERALKPCLTAPAILV